MNLKNSRILILRLLFNLLRFTIEIDQPIPTIHIRIHNPLKCTSTSFVTPDLCAFCRFGACWITLQSHLRTPFTAANARLRAHTTHVHRGMGLSRDHTALGRVFSRILSGQGTNQKTPLALPSARNAARAELI